MAACCPVRQATTPDSIFTTYIVSKTFWTAITTARLWRDNKLVTQKSTEKKAEKDTSIPLYKIMVYPHVEHGVQVGASQIKKDIVELGKIQRTGVRVTRER